MDALDHDTDIKPATDGEIAVINLESARQRAWDRFWQAPQRPGVAEYVIEQEQLTTQFLGDQAGFDRLDALVEHLDDVESKSPRTSLIHAQVASMTHRFAEARSHLARATFHGAPPDAVNRLTLSIDQACGTNLDAVLDVRRSIAAKSGRLEDYVPLGALLADLREFLAADQTYRRALREYDDVSPFAVAWVCFQLGVLWGELVSEPQPSRAAQWYRKAIDYLPCYVTARVHLSEILLDDGDPAAARALLSPVLESGDPEVPWRLADVAIAVGDDEELASHLEAARAGFEALLAKHPLAFADHAAEFYLGSGSDARRAFELARLNLANRPTARAFELYADASDRCGESKCPTAEHS